MQSDQTPNERLTSEQLNFLINDYWQKVQYLKDHFARLWNRFNYFLTIQSALFGATVLSPDKFRWWVPIFAALVCLLWYIFGAQDRYLVDLYRKEIEQALDQLRPQLRLENYYSVGQTEDRGPQEIDALGVKQGFSQWRWTRMSTTKLPAQFPVILLIMWLGILLVLLIRAA